MVPYRTETELQLPRIMTMMMVVVVVASSAMMMMCGTFCEKICDRMRTSAPLSRRPGPAFLPMSVGIVISLCPGYPGGCTLDKSNPASQQPWDGTRLVMRSHSHLERTQKRTRKHWVASARDTVAQFKAAGEKRQGELKTDWNGFHKDCNGRFGFGKFVL